MEEGKDWGLEIGELRVHGSNHFFGFVGFVVPFALGIR
jgi:hypothetical protein